MQWICLVHGVVGCSCGSRDVAPWGGGAFHEWSRPRKSDIYVNLTPPAPRPGYVVELVKTAQLPGPVVPQRPRRKAAR